MWKKTRSHHHPRISTLQLHGPYNTTGGMLRWRQRVTSSRHQASFASLKRPAFFSSLSYTVDSWDTQKNVDLWNINMKFWMKECVAIRFLCFPRFVAAVKQNNEIPRFQYFAFQWCADAKTIVINEYLELLIVSFKIAQRKHSSAF